MADRASSRALRGSRKRTRGYTADYHEIAGERIEVWPLISQVLRQFVDTDRASGRGVAGSGADPAVDLRRACGSSRGEGRKGTERWQGKIKSHVTCDTSRRRGEPSRESRPFRGASWSWHRRGAGSVSPRVLSDMRTGCRRRADRGRTARRNPDLVIHVNLSTERLALALHDRHGNPHSRGCVAICRTPGTTAPTVLEATSGRRRGIGLSPCTSSLSAGRRSLGNGTWSARAWRSVSPDS